MNKILPWVLASGCLTAFGCTLAEVKIDVVSERTSLENQVLGTYNSLDNEMLQVASVRGVDPSGELRAPPSRSQESRDAVLAIQTLAFHEDDLQRFKLLGWVGERSDGLLEPFARPEEISEEHAEFIARTSDEEFRSVVAAVNQARMEVMRRVVDLNEALGDADLSEVQQVFGKLNAETASSGDRVQQTDGSWSVKP